MPSVTLYPTADFSIATGVTHTPATGEFWDKIGEDNGDDDTKYISIPNEDTGSNQVLFNWNVPSTVRRAPIVHVVTVARFRVDTPALEDFGFGYLMQIDGTDYDMYDGRTQILQQAGDNPNWEDNTTTFTSELAHVSLPPAIPNNVHPVNLVPWTWDDIDELALGVRYLQDGPGGTALDISKLTVTVRYGFPIYPEWYYSGDR